MATKRNKTRKKKASPKINRKKTEANGILFDSKLEADYYEILLERAERGEITEIVLQPPFELVEPFELRGKKIRGMRYTPDFSYYEDGQYNVVECKGFTTESYRMRRKLFLLLFGEDCIFHQVSRKYKTWKTKTW